MKLHTILVLLWLVVSSPCFASTGAVFQHEIPQGKGIWKLELVVPVHMTKPRATPRTITVIEVPQTEVRAGYSWSF